MIKRPVVFSVTAWVLGLIGGILYMEHIQVFPLFLILGIISVVLYIYFKDKRSIVLFLVSALLGTCACLMHPAIQSVALFKEKEIVSITGVIEEISFNDYAQNLVLKKVKKDGKRMGGKVQVKANLYKTYKIGETLDVKGCILAFPEQMNPSDFNYGDYLKAQNIVAIIEARECQVVGEVHFSLRQVSQYLDKHLETIYQGEDAGIMSAALLGQNDRVEDEVYTSYSAVGIGHLLSVSGFHVSLIVSFLLGLSIWMGLSYTTRYIVSILGVWMYCILTGMAASTVRATIMVSLMMGARILWEEEDFWTSMAISALINLLWRPYQILAIGFQLSYAAVIAIGISKIYLEKYKEKVTKTKKRILNLILPWLCITCLTTPIIAYHYFEVPCLGNLLNLIIIPIFSCMIMLGWLTLGLHLIGLPIIGCLVKGMIVTLDGVAFLCDLMMQIPLGTVCVGRPSWLDILVYYGILFMIGLRCYGITFKKAYKWSGAILLSGYFGLTVLFPHQLKITCLYVGQGDGAVIETPHNKTIVIDGGNFGKGKVLMDYIKSQGKKEVDVAIVSHGDSDHIGGVIELVSSDFKVKRVIVSQMEESELFFELQEVCEVKQVPIFSLGAGDNFIHDQVKFQVVAPYSNQGDLNNNSLVCLVTYKDFKALFTGDKEKTSESYLYHDIAPISFLKVSHHGSKTGTEEKLLLKLRPQYAMISCGINNLYGHPHKEVLEALEKSHVPYGRTDKEGAIWICTNGQSMTLYTHREET